jgi:hypothetical protein
LHERRLLTDLLETYNRLERPVQNETEAVILYFGLTLQQIIDVVSIITQQTNEKNRYPSNDQLLQWLSLLFGGLRGACSAGCCSADV